MSPIRRDDLEVARCVHGEARERRCSGTLRKAFDLGRGQVNEFNFGQVVATPGALTAFVASGELFFARHVK